MSNLDKNIIITPNVGASDDPKIVFSAANTTSNAANITLRAYPTSNGTLSFEGSAGQLFSITNNLTGTLFSVNDISGIPSIEVLDTGRVNLAQYNGSVVIGANTSATTSNSNTTGELVVFGGVGVTGNIYVGGTSAGSNGIYTDILRYAANGLPWVMGSGGGGGGTSIDQAARDTANSASANTFIIQGVDASQNVRLDFSNAAITIIQGTDTSQNARMVIIEGTDISQNARMTIADGVDASQNVRLDYSNTAITIIQGTDTSQNARMTIIEGTDASQNIRLDFSNTRMTIIDGVDASQNVRLDYSNTALTITQGVDNSQNVRLNFSNTRMDISDGVDVSQNVRLDYSNTAITIIQGVDVGQNTRLTVIEGTDTSQNVRLDYSNTALTITQGVDNSQNVRLDYSNTAIIIIQGTDVTQNTRLTVIEGTDASQNARMAIIEGTDASQNVRLDYSNTTITIIQGVDVGQNTRLSVIEGTNLSQNVRIDYSNTAITQVDNKAQAAFDKANTGGGGASPFGYLANTIIVANSTGYLSNSNSFILANNTLITSNVIIDSGISATNSSTGALRVRGGVGVDGSIYATVINAQTASLTGQTLTLAGADAFGNSITNPTRQLLTGQITYQNFSGTSTADPSAGAQNYLRGAIYKNFTSPTTGNVITLFVGAPRIDASANTVGVTPYAIWSNGSIYVANGSIYVANNITVNNGIEIVTSVLANNVVTPSPSVVLNDITNQFDNLKCVFDLRSEQSNVINIMNSRNLEVIINGAKLAPYVTDLRYPWLTPYDSFKGHRVVSSNTSSQLVIYNPPAPGDQAILTLINNSSASQNRRYPYSAATIALGD